MEKNAERKREAEEEAKCVKLVQRQYRFIRHMRGRGERAVLMMQLRYRLRYMRRNVMWKRHPQSDPFVWKGSDLSERRLDRPYGGVWTQVEVNPGAGKAAATIQRQRREKEKFRNKDLSIEIPP